MALKAITINQKPMPVKINIQNKERIHIGPGGHKTTTGEQKTPELLKQEQDDAKFKVERQKKAAELNKSKDEEFERKEADRVKKLMDSGMSEAQAKGFRVAK